MPKIPLYLPFKVEPIIEIHYQDRCVKGSNGFRNVKELAEFLNDNPEELSHWATFRKRSSPIKFHLIPTCWSISFIKFSFPPLPPSRFCCLNVYSLEVGTSQESMVFQFLWSCSFSPTVAR